MKKIFFIISIVEIYWEISKFKVYNETLPTDNTPNVIMNGTKKIQMKFRKIKFQDLHCFITMAISEFANSFELNELNELKKCLIS